MVEGREELGLLAASPEEVVAASESEVRMLREEAVERTGRIRSSLGEVRADLVEIEGRQGYLSLGYRSMREYMLAEFDESQPQLYRQLTAGKIEREISPIGEMGQIPESHLRPLAALKQPDRQRQAWERVVTESQGGRIIAKDVERVVRQMIDEKPPPPAPDLVMVSECPQRKPVSAVRLNRTNEKVDWAQWTWNPVTGCLHDCPYCYARDIANRFYAEGFKPTFHPERLPAPRNTPIPDDPNPASRRIFTCSMADLFGKWVPQEWIDAVFREVRDNPLWEFLFLTKFPQRLAELEWPENAWVGTTVDRQYRVSIAEKAFRGVKAGVKWLSCEPMLEPLKFSSLEMFDWVVIGGASRSSQTPEFWPPFEWVVDLYRQAREAGCKVWFKPNAISGLTECPREIPR